MRTESGWVNNLEIYGYAWGSPMVITEGKFRGLKIADLILSSPIGRNIDYPINIRSSRTESHVFIEDFEIDANHLTEGGIIFFEGQHLSLKDGTIRTQESGTATLFYLRNGKPNGADVEVVDVSIEHRSTSRFFLTPHRPPFQKLLMSDVYIRFPEDGQYDNPIQISPRRIDGKQTFIFNNITGNFTSNYLFQLDQAQSGSAGLDVFVSGDYIKHRRLVGHPERSDGMLQVFFSNCTYDSDRLTSADREVAHFDNCTDTTSGQASSNWTPSVKPWPADITLPAL